MNLPTGCQVKMILGTNPLRCPNRAEVRIEKGRDVMLVCATHAKNYEAGGYRQRLAADPGRSR